MSSNPGQATLSERNIEGRSEKDTNIFLGKRQNVRRLFDYIQDKKEQQGREKQEECKLKTICSKKERKNFSAQEIKNLSKKTSSLFSNKKNQVEKINLCVQYLIITIFVF